MYIHIKADARVYTQACTLSRRIRIIANHLICDNRRDNAYKRVQHYPLSNNSSLVRRRYV